MTEENLKRGVEINKELDFINKQIEHIEKSNGVRGTRIELNNGVDGYDLYLHKQFIDFDVLITLAKAKITAQKEALEKEFASL